MSAARVAAGLARWQPRVSQLSTSSRQALDDLTSYLGAEAPRIAVFAAQPSLLADWREGTAGVFPPDWELREAVGSGSEGEPAGLFCDAVVLVATALHLDSAARGELLAALRRFDLPTFLVLTRFQQMSRAEETVERKKREAARRLGILRLRVFAVAPQAGPGLLPLPEVGREIQAAVEASRPEVHDRHADALFRHWLGQARAELTGRLEGLRERHHHLRAEWEVARATEGGTRVLAGTVGEPLRRWGSEFAEGVASLTWAGVRPALELEAAAADEDWGRALRRALSATLQERWRKLEEAHVSDLEARLEGLIAGARRDFEKTLAALVEGPAGFGSAELAPLRAAIADDGPFRAIRERARTTAQSWRPLSAADIAGVVDEEGRGLDLVLADYLGRRLKARADRELLPAGETDWPGPAQGPSVLDLPVAGPGGGGLDGAEGPGSESSALRQWLHHQTAGGLRERVAEMTLGSVLGKLDALLARRVEEKRKALVEEDLPLALDAYFSACFEAYSALQGGLRERTKALDSALAETFE